MSNVSDADRTLRSAMHRRIAQLSSPFAFQCSSGNRWTAPRCFVGPESAESVPANLLADFDLEDMRRLGILSAPDEDPPRLHPKFLASAGPMFGITYRDGESFCLLSYADLARRARVASQAAGGI